MRHRASFPPTYRVHRLLLAAVFAILLVAVAYALVALVEALFGGLLFGLLADLRLTHLVGP